MALKIKGDSGTKRRLRLGMVGGGQGAFIGAVHRMASRLDDRYELVAGALSSDPRRARASGKELGLAKDRIYTDYHEMAQRESQREDGIDAVAIVTPNNVHLGPTKAFLDAGIHVILDKPMTATLAEAKELEKAVRKSRLVFGLTHTYTGYPMVRQAREMVAAGLLGKIRMVQVEYPQDWLSEPLEKSGNKQAVWRTDPKRTGPAGSLGDIGTHAYNMACFVTGLKCDAVCADVHTFVPGRKVDDNVHVMLRFRGGAKGMLWASQVAVGSENNIMVRVFGEKAGLEWRHEDMNYLKFTPFGQTPQRLSRSGAGSMAYAAHASRVPAGHPEGYIEGFTQLYTDLAEQISAKIERRKPDPASLLVPGIDAGMAGMKFIDAVLRSSARNSAWVKL
ncbi:MAG TPA: Gfo/Idh/MocA family oxidoreductase [Magnetospirillaceae bacterium]|jgi:predicted dehydrogenase